ncbi:MAG: response regulator [Lachnospiraceae bacterium]|nr:response regulator [Lachnospiraceae bacterium]
MVKLFLVEDEIVMRDGIKRHINWKKEDIEFVGEASDGELAYPMILDLKPDILITDIKMPFMDGLELSSLVKKELPGIHIIILSGYDEFSYAQQAVSIGVTQYLLKPITPKKLLESIKEVQEKIEEERIQASEADWSLEETKEKNDIAKTKLIDAIVMNSLSMSEILEQGKNIDINLTARFYRIVLLQINIKGEQGDAFSETRNDFIDKLIIILDKQNASWHMVDRGMDGFLFLVLGNEEESILKELDEGINEIVEIIKETPNMDYFIGVGPIVNRLSEVRNTYFGATKALSHRFMTGSDHIVYSNGSGNSGSKDKDREAEGQGLEKVSFDAFISGDTSHKAIETFVKTGSYDEIDPFIDEVFERVGEVNLNSLVFMNYIIMDCYFILAKFVNQIGGDNSEIESKIGDINSLLSDLKDWRQASDYLKEYLKCTVNLRDGKTAKKYGKVLQKAISYIDENYMREDISLNTVAAQANISPNHFSAIFSQEMGITFIEYLIKKRIDKACELLMTTDMKSSEVAYKVGYKDPHYFSYTFKKTVGMTTKEYRARGRNAEKDQ